MTQLNPDKKDDLSPSQEETPPAQPSLETVLKKSNLFSKVLSVIMVLTATYTIVIVSVNALMRYFIRKDIYGIEELTALIAFWMYFAGAVYCSKQRTHISAEVLSILFKNPYILYAMSLFQRVVTLICCAFFAWYGIKYFQWGIVMGAKTNLLQIPTVYANGPITVGFCAMLVYCLRDLIMIFKIKPSEYRSGLV